MVVIGFSFRLELGSHNQPWDDGRVMRAVV